METTKQIIEKKIQDLISSNYDKEKKVWFNDDKTICDTNQTKEFQKKIRDLKFYLQMADEETELSKVISNEQHPTYKKLMPLVSRRLHTELWPNLGKTGKVLQDGNLFTFNPVEFNTEIYCNCTTAQLEREIEIANGVEEGNTQWFWEQSLDNEHTKMLKDRRDSHNESFIKEDGLYLCENPKKIEVHQNKHTIGNWNCQACLTSGQEIRDTEDASAAMSAGKATEWCPRFLPLLRALTISHYIEMLKPQQTNLENNICYAGLLHSEISFEEEDIMKFVVITKKCDTCDYKEIERKAYFQPEEIKDNEPLVNLGE